MKTIAIIDDDIHIGDMLREVLVQEGYSVRRSCSRRRKKSKLCMKNFYKNRLENF